MGTTTPKQIEKELTVIEKGVYRPWGTMSLLLDSIENTGYWHRDSDSFTSWLEKNAFRLNKRRVRSKTKRIYNIRLEAKDLNR